MISNTIRKGAHRIGQSKEFVHLYVFKWEAVFACVMSSVLYFIAPSEISINSFKEILGFVLPVVAIFFTTYFAIFFAALAVMLTVECEYLRILDALKPVKILGAFGALLVCVAIMVAVFIVTILVMPAAKLQISTGVIIFALFWFMYCLAVAFSVMWQIIEETFKHVALKKS